MTGLLGRTFERLLDLRAGEAPLALRAFFTLFGIIAAHTLLETARDALFLGTLPVSRLALVYVALACFGLVVPSYTSRFVRNFGRRNALVSTLMVAALGTTLLYFRPVTEPMVYALYIWSGLLSTVLVIQFWLLTGQLFTVAQGKRLFAGVTSGGVLGAVSGGVLATGLLALFEEQGHAGVRNLLLAAAAIFLATALVLTTIPRSDRGVDVRPERAPAPIFGALRMLREHPYVLRVAIIVALGTATVMVTDYLFKFVAKATIDSDALGTFFARYYAVLNSLALLVQLVVAQRVLKRAGVVGALLVLPFVLLLGGGGLLLFGGTLALVMVTKGADGVLRHSLHRAASELLYLPLPSKVRDASKSLVDAVFVRGAQALTAGVILVLASLGFQSIRLLAVGVLGLATLWLLAMGTVRRGYVDLFRQALSRGVIDARLMDARLTIDTVESLMQAISSEEPARVKAALEMLRSVGRLGLVPPLIFYHPHSEVLQHALSILTLDDNQHCLPHALRLRHHHDSGVRVAALRALGVAHQTDAIRELLNDDDPTVRAHAVFQLARCEGVDTPDVQPLLENLQTYAQTATPEQLLALRIAFSEALALDADERWRDILFNLPLADDPTILRNLAVAMGRIADPIFIPKLLPLLDSRIARGAATQALVEIGSSALDALETALIDDETPPRLRRQIPLAVAQFGSQRAADLLDKQLKEEPDGALRYRLLRGLGRLVTQYPIRLNQKNVTVRLEAALREHLRVLAIWQPLRRQDSDVRRGASAVLLDGLLKDKARQALQRAGRLFHLLHPKEDVRGVFSALASTDRYVRASAQEFLDALALEQSSEIRDMLRLASDDLSSGERVSRAADYLDVSSDSVAESLNLLLQDNDDAIVELAAYHALVLREPATDQQVQRVMATRPELLCINQAVQHLKDPNVVLAPSALLGPAAEQPATSSPNDA